MPCSQQRLRFAQPLARRRMAAQRFCRLLTLSDLISAISAPVLRSVFGFAPAPLRGSLRQQPREALVGEDLGETGGFGAKNSTEVLV